MTDLLDVNFLLALAWPNHLSHKAAAEWMNGRSVKGFATCPITECGFIRLSLNPAVVSEVVGIETVLAVLKAFKNLKGHQFWPDDLESDSVFSAIPGPLGHRQVTDTYLLALSAKNRGRLVTFDQGFLSLANRYPAGTVLILS